MQELFEQLKDNESLMFYDDAFKDFIEMHLADLRAASVTGAGMLTLSPHDRNRANGNFNLLCSIAKVPFHHHWLMLRINGYTEYNQYRSDTDVIYMLNHSYLDSLKRQFRESQSIT